MFTLLNLESAETIARAQFADGKAAARAARLLTRKTGIRFQPRPVAAPVDWQARERARFASGEYVRLHEELEAISPDSHFAHCAKKSPDLIAYTKDAAKGAADKQSLISIESYVALVAADWPDDSKAALIKLQQDHAAAHCSPLKFARTPDEIESVYTNYDDDAGHVANSCMRYEARQFASRVDGRPFHPVRVYGAGDLAIAYLANEDGETIARALVWPEKKIYSRLYCGENSTLARLLKAQGYEGAGYYHGRRSMSGARLLRVESDCGELVAPYLDEVGTVQDCGEYLRIGGDINAQNTNGLCDSTPRFFCEHCGESCDEDVARLVFTDGARRREQHWCEYCADSYAFYCHGYQDYFSDSVDSGEMGGESFSLAWLENHAYICERTNEWTDDVCDVVVDDRGNTESWCASFSGSEFYKYDGTYYSDDLDSEYVITRRAEMVAIAWRGLCWLRDVRVKIPTHIIEEAAENGEPLAFEASDGRLYAPDYEDCYPVDRPRLVPAENGQMVLPAIAA